MKINTKIRYGLRMLVFLAESKSVINTSELGKRMQVSPKYLRKLAGPMEKYKLLRSVQGIYGGYVINKKPEEIKVSNVFEAFDEDMNITGCLADKDCQLNEGCYTRVLWKHIEDIVHKEFTKVSIKDIIENNIS